MSLRTKALIAIVALSLIDVIIPVPILGLLLVHAIYARPPWVRALAREVVDR